MPPVSQAQRRWAFANRNKKGAEGKAAREFAKADPGGKLPAKVKDGKPVKSRSERWYGKKD
ncbi:hypothetical protein ACRQ5Q_22320 [Bradyrhizobium sp. PMVTL-01]|uniref:hypothetical protein n=1 Tax=Bradyrhizobium sp. PMVTL-01 TaxID=3434999 RepID=UPI003F6F944B